MTQNVRANKITEYLLSLPSDTVFFDMGGGEYTIKEIIETLNQRATRNNIRHIADLYVSDYHRKEDPILSGLCYEYINDNEDMLDDIESRISKLSDIQEEIDILSSGRTLEEYDNYLSAKYAKEHIEKIKRENEDRQRTLNDSKTQKLARLQKKYKAGFKIQTEGISTGQRVCNIYGNGFSDLLATGTGSSNKEAQENALLKIDI